MKKMILETEIKIKKLLLERAAAQVNEKMILEIKNKIQKIEAAQVNEKNYSLNRNKNSKILIWTSSSTSE